MKYIIFSVLFFTFCLLSPSIILAAESYSDAINQAISNAGGSGKVSSTWLADPSSIVSINSSDTHGLQYDSGGNLIVRTASSYGSFLVTNNYYVHNDYIYREGTSPKADSAAWVTTGNDATKFLQNNGVTASNVVTLTERGLGMNNTGTHTVMIEYSVSPDNDHLQRPTKNPDITTYNGVSSSNQYGNSNSDYPFVQPAGMDDTIYGYFSASDGFYVNHLKASYGEAGGGSGDGTFPYTQLGYTYFWGNGSSNPTSLSQVQGMTEFVILPGTTVNIYAIYAMQSYIYTLNKNGSMNSDSDAQYGNGFASFHLTGNCDTIWAGHRFQAKTQSPSSGQNQIIVDSGCSVSSGQGILVWSLNYLLTNRGTITSDGSTNKYFESGTSGIGILFDGDTSTTYGTPVTSGTNEVVNYGTISGNSSNTGTAIKVLNGDTEITNNAGGTIIGTTAIDCSDSNFTGTVSIKNRGTISGTIALKSGVSTDFDIGNTALTVTNGKLSSLNVGANSAADYGVLNTTGTTADASTTVTLTPGGYIPNNTSMTVMTANAGSISAVPGTINSASPVFSVSGAVSSNNLVLTATRAHSYNSFASSSNADAAGSVLNTLAMNNSASGDMVTVLGSLDSLTSGGQIDSALNALSPGVDNSPPQISEMTQQQFVSTVLAHLDGFKNVMDNMFKGVDVWTSGFGSYIHQDAMSFSNGYDASIWGTTLGFDIPALDNFRAGLAGGFAQDFVRTKDFSNRTDIDSYQGTLYTSYAKEAYFIDTAFSFAYNNYDAQRQVAFGLLNRTAKGDYNGQQYSGYIQGGYKFTGKGIELTPIASFLYSHLRLNGYTESGAGAADLKVDPQDYDIAQTGLGMKVGYPLELKKIAAKATPEFKFKWLYDWVGDAQQTTSTFTGGGGSFGTNGFTPAQSSYDFGLKLTVETVNNITLSLSYDLEIKEDYYGHYGYAALRYRFK